MVTFALLANLNLVYVEVLQLPKSLSLDLSFLAPQASSPLAKFISVCWFQDLQGSAYTHEPIGGRLHLILYVLFGKYWANFS